MSDFFLGIIADDVTGGAESAASFVSGGHGEARGVLLMFHEAAATIALNDEPVWALSTTSRPLLSDEAFERARDTACALLENASLRRPVRFYKKADSLLRGNIGAETEGFMEGAGLSFSLIAPAHPLNGRTTAHDIHFLNGVPVSETEAGSDPVTPVRTSSLSRTIAAQCLRLVSHIEQSRLEGGLDRLADDIRTLADGGIGHFTFDATEPEHLDRIARLALDYFPNSLPVGSGGLAQALAKRGGFAFSSASEERRAAVLPIAARPLVVLGTASVAARRQVDVLQARYRCRIVDIAPHDLLDGACVTLPEILRTSADDACIDVLRLTPPEGGPSIDLTLALAEEFGRLSAAVVRANSPGALYASGGDTAVAVLSALRGQAIRVIDEVIPGFVRGRVVGGEADGLLISTKPGMFGGGDALLLWAQALRLPACV